MVILPNQLALPIEVTTYQTVIASFVSKISTDFFYLIEHSSYYKKDFVIPVLVRYADPDDRVRTPVHLRHNGYGTGGRRRGFPVKNSASRNEQNHRRMKT